MAFLTVYYLKRKYRYLILSLKLDHQGKYNEEEMKKMEAEKAEQEAAELKLAQAIHVGDRCEVTIPNSLPKRGLVSFMMDRLFNNVYVLWLKKT